MLDRHLIMFVQIKYASWSLSTFDVFDINSPLLAHIPDHNVANQDQCSTSNASLTHEGDSCPLF